MVASPWRVVHPAEDSCAAPNRGTTQRSARMLGNSILDRPRIDPRSTPDEIAPRRAAPNRPQSWVAAIPWAPATWVAASSGDKGCGDPMGPHGLHRPHGRPIPWQRPTPWRQRSHVRREIALPPDAPLVWSTFHHIHKSAMRRLRSADIYMASRCACSWGCSATSRPTCFTSVGVGSASKRPNIASAIKRRLSASTAYRTVSARRRDVGPVAAEPPSISAVVVIAHVAATSLWAHSDRPGDL